MEKRDSVFVSRLTAAIAGKRRSKKQKLIELQLIKQQLQKQLHSDSAMLMSTVTFRLPKPTEHLESLLRREDAL